MPEIYKTKNATYKFQSAQHLEIERAIKEKVTELNQAYDRSNKNSPFLSMYKDNAGVITLTEHYTQQDIRLKRNIGMFKETEKGLELIMHNTFVSFFEVDKLHKIKKENKH